MSAAAGRRMLGLLLAGEDTEPVDIASTQDLQALGRRQAPTLLLRLRSRIPLPDAAAAARDALGGVGRLGVVLDNPWRLPFGGRRVQALRAALRAAGFADVVAYTLAPSSTEPLELQPQVACLVPACFVTARIGQPDSTSPLEQVERGLRGTLAEAGPSARCRLERIVASAKDKCLVFLRAGDAHIVVRVAYGAAAQGAEAHAHGVLAELQRNAAVAAMVPIALWSGVIGGSACFAETMLQGKPLKQVLNARARSSYAAAAESFLRALNPGLRLRAPGPLDARRTRPMLDRVLAWTADAELERRVRGWFDAALAQAACRVGIEHGDFGLGNLLVRDRHLCGVVDWEDVQPRGLPLLDSFNYLDSAQRHVDGVTLADTLPRLAAGDWPVAAERDLLQRSFDDCGVDQRMRPGFALLYGLSHFDTQFRYGPPDLQQRERIRLTLQRLTAQPAQALPR